MRLAILALVTFVAGPAAIADAPAASESGFEELTKQVERYVKQRKELARGLEKPGDKAAPEEIERYQLALRERVIASRSAAKQGDLLSADLLTLLGAVRSETEGSQNTEAKDTVLRDGNPAEDGKAVPLSVNAPYPPDAPKSTVPPGLLARLPSLPEGVEFRFVGRSLILYDSEIDLILDYLRGVVN